jgi:hypothetical protein
MYYFGTTDHLIFRGPPKGGHALVTSIALARSCGYPSEVPAAIPQSRAPDQSRRLAGTRRRRLQDQRLWCAVGSSAGVPDVLFGTVDQEAGPAEECRETERLVDALLKIYFESIIQHVAISVARHRPKVKSHRENTD